MSLLPFPSAIVDAPQRAGLILREGDMRAVLAERPDIGWFEVEAARLLRAGEAEHYALGAVRALYPMALLVAAEAGSEAGRWIADRLDRLAALCRFYAPFCVTARLDLEAPRGPDRIAPRLLAKTVVETRRLRGALARPLMLAGPLGPILIETARRTGCALALDLGALSSEPGADARAALARTPRRRAGQFRLCGQVRAIGPDGAPRAEPSAQGRIGRAAWVLLADAVARFGPRPTLLVWDAEDAGWSRRCAEAGNADHVLLTGGAARRACAF